MTLDAQLVVLAKQPVAGRAKTRLTPPLLPAQAADIALAALRDTLAAVAGVGVRGTVVLAGVAGEWLPAGVHLLPQADGDLGARLAAAFDATYAVRQVPILLIGMDTPQVTPELLRTCLTRLLTPGIDAVLGLADDGGWWALGLRRPIAGVFDGVPMSTAWTGSAQAQRLLELRLHTAMLPTMRDIDRFADLGPVAAQLPEHSWLRRVAAGLAPVPA